MVDQTEIPEPVHEHAEHHGEHSDDGFRRLAAIYLGVVAMLLAISSLGGGKATKEMLNAAIHASDTYAFAQAKYLRETAYELAAATLWLRPAIVTFSEHWERERGTPRTEEPEGA